VLNRHSKRSPDLTLATVYRSALKLRIEIVR
jgi:hypothetical protein